jgi:hypothetical protein
MNKQQLRNNILKEGDLNALGKMSSFECGVSIDEETKKEILETLEKKLGKKILKAQYELNVFGWIKEDKN